MVSTRPLTQERSSAMFSKMKSAFRRSSIQNPVAENHCLSLADVVDEDEDEEEEEVEEEIFYEEPKFEYMFSVDAIGTELETLSTQLCETDDGDEQVSKTKLY